MIYTRPKKETQVPLHVVTECDRMSLRNSQKTRERKRVNDVYCGEHIASCSNLLLRLTQSHTLQQEISHATQHAGRRRSRIG